ncbi:class I SAM-dependent methyltransferase [Reinekea sp.]|jgi:16S rRNA (guanine1516-N2)-methyltransferase|uniref:class I SAM-dependent methyltransferase n=1 Tax=Reinekea sp. TaxID=1970455 RepID=UPI002A82A84F|nr:class I SAM-dependent methyltransferase [Reinekea sp.]
MHSNSGKDMNLQLYCPNPKRYENQLLFRDMTALDWIDIIKRPGEQPFLIIEQGMLGLADANWPKVHPVYVDFQSGAVAHRRLYGGGAGQAVAKAVGLNKKKNLRILDATAGLGRDAFVMASLGAQVLMLERHRGVHLLLADGLYRLGFNGELGEIQQRLTLSYGSLSYGSLSYGSLSHESLSDAGQALEQFAPEVIYLDPMFPERVKSAKVKKEMAIFQELVGDDVDADALLAPALALAEFRVVVKRPKQAPHLAAQVPTTALIGKSSRFDIYSKKAIS